MNKFVKWLDGQGVGGDLNAQTKWGSFIPDICLFFPQAQFLNKFFSTQKCVNRDKIDFAPIQRKWQQSRFRDKSA